MSKKGRGFGVITDKRPLIDQFHSFIKEDHETLIKLIKKYGSCVRFFKYNGKVYTNQSKNVSFLPDPRHLIVPVLECDRYQIKDFKPIVEAAINDLSEKRDAIWYFTNNKWFHKPLPDNFSKFIIS